MIDFSQYATGSVIHVQCNDGRSGCVFIRNKGHDHRAILVRESGCVAKIDNCGSVVTVYGDTGAVYAYVDYSVSRIISVLGVSTTTVIREKDEGNDEPRFAVLPDSGFVARNHTLDSAVCLAEKMVEDGRSSLVHVAKIVKVVQSKSVAVTSDYKPEVEE